MTSDAEMIQATGRIVPRQHQRDGSDRMSRQPGSAATSTREPHHRRNIRPRPAAPYPPPRRLGLLPAFRAARSNPIALFSEEAYREPVVEYREIGGSLLVNDPQTIVEILLGESTEFAKSNQTQRLLAPLLGRGLAIAEGQTWEVTRRIAAPYFKPQTIARFLKNACGCAEAMLGRWRRRDAPDSPLDISHEMLRLTCEIISKTLTSGDLDRDCERFRASLTRYVETAGKPDLATVLDLPAWVPGLSRVRAFHAIRTMRRIVDHLFQERKRQMEGHAGDFVDRLIGTKDQKTGQMLSHDLVRDNICTFIAAGHDTTGLALTWIVYLLALHPDAEARVLEELSMEIGDAPASAEDLGRLVYTRAVVNESLRLYPPFPLIGLTPLTTVELCGRQVKPSTPVTVSPWVVHRHRALWDEPDYFKPERFLPSAAKTIRRGAFIPFGMGPRGCIGMNSAVQTILAVLALVLPRFSFRLADPNSVFPVAGVTLRPAGGLPAFVTPRQ